MSQHRSNVTIGGRASSVATGNSLSRQGILCRDRELKKVYRDRKFLVTTGIVVWCHDTAFWCRDKAGLVGRRRDQSYSQWARLHTRKSAQHARQSAMCMHCAHDRPVTVHCVAHYLGSLFMGTVKKKEYKKMTPGNLGRLTRSASRDNILFSQDLSFQIPSLSSQLFL